MSTRVSNSLLVGKEQLFLFYLPASKSHTGAIIGQVVVGLICDRIGRKAALVITTALVVLGATLATAAHGAGGSAAGLFWFLTVARQIIYFILWLDIIIDELNRGITGVVSRPELWPALHITNKTLY